MERYEVNGWAKNSEEDDYEQGEIGNGHDLSGPRHWHADTIPALVEQLMEFAGTDDPSAVVLWPDDEDAGRIDVTVYEGADGAPAYGQDRADWIAGRKRLWYATYSFSIERVERSPVGLARLQADLPNADLA